MFDATPLNAPDLPPRTWHGWWLAWPKWFRIGCWAGLGAVLLNVAVAVRIFVGLQEPAEIRALRARRVGVFYAWEFPANSPERRGPRRFDPLIAGLYGKSWGNVVEIQSNMLTDDDLRLIGRNGRSLIRLMLPHANITPDGLRELRRCRELGLLDLSGTDLDDEAVEALGELTSLRNLNLADTLVSDRALPVFERLPLLEKVNVQYTDVTEAAVLAQAWRIRHHRTLVIRRGRSDESLKTESYGSIRWSDGTRSAGIPFNHNFRRKYFKYGTPIGGSTSASGLSRSKLLWSGSSSAGEYRLTLGIGDYDAEPVIIQMDEDCRASMATFEFRMPCTKAAALRSARTP